MKPALMIMLNLPFLSTAKKFLIETRQKYSKRPHDDTHYDYMEDPISQNIANKMAIVKIRNVDVGNSVDLKCTSPKEFSTCFFSKKDGDNYYRVRPGAKFLDNRLHCLCDVSIQSWKQILILGSKLIRGYYP